MADRKTYIVKSGDTLSKIAKTYSTTTAKLAEWNKITNINVIRVGQKLFVEAELQKPAVTDAEKADQNKVDVIVPPKETTKVGETEVADIYSEAKDRVPIKTTAMNLTRSSYNLTDADKRLLEKYIETAVGKSTYKGMTQAQKDELLKRYANTPEAMGLLTELENFQNQKNSNMIYEDVRLDEDTVMALGRPFVFTDEVDRNNRVFNEHFRREAPLLFIIPGEPLFLPSVNNSKIRSSMLKWFMTEEEIEASTYDEIMSEIGKDVRYFGFKPRLDTYLTYVDSMVSYLAHVMGIQNEKYPVKTTDTIQRVAPLYKFRLAEYLGLMNFSDKLEKLVSDAQYSLEYLTFYIDASSSSFSEGGDTSTSESKVAGVLKSGSDIKKELDFVFGANTSNRLENTGNDKVMEDVSRIFDTANSQNMIDRLKESFTTLGAGGNLLLPEIWQDSAFRKSYNLQFSLYSPYGDKLSIFLHVLVPLISLLALSLPRSVTTTGYAAPYLIKGFCKGWFNFDYGIVDNISITRGGSNADGWSANDLPTSITVQLSIKDLYSTLTMASSRHAKVFATNTGMLEYLETLGSFDFRRIDDRIRLGISHKLGLLANALNPVQRVEDVIRNMFINIDQVIGGGF